MASLDAIMRGKTLQSTLDALIGVKPALDIQSDHVRVYYPPESLPQAQESIKKLMTKEPGEVRVDIFKAFQPWVFKEAMPFLIGAGVGGYIFGNM